MEICHFKGLGLEGGIILKCVLRKYGNMPFKRPRLGRWDNIKVCLEEVWKYAI
jgi:hypothetical protein